MQQKGTEVKRKRKYTKRKGTMREVDEKLAELRQAISQMLERKDRELSQVRKILGIR